VVEYVLVAQQPTTLESTESLVSKTLQNILESRGFPVQRTANMDGWLTYHTVFIACILSALLKVGADPLKLGRDSKLLKTMCRAIEEGFKSLKVQHVQGAPKNLALLHSPLLRPIAVSYWGSVMRSPKGELYFAAHVRHAPDEVKTLTNWVLKHVVQGNAKTSYLLSLLRPPK